MNYEGNASFQSIEPWVFKAKLSYCEIWQNAINGMIAEAYLLPSNYIKQEENNYFQRMGEGIVKCLGIIYLSDNLNGYVLIERITNRLSNLDILTEAQTLRVLFCVFRTLDKVKWVDFWLKETCVCFNTEGQVKIWKNSELWNNAQENNYPKNQNSQDLVASVIKVVQNKCINPQVLQPLYVLSLSQISYEKVYQTILKIAQQTFIDIGCHHQVLKSNISSCEPQFQYRNMTIVENNIKSPNHRRKASYSEHFQTKLMEKNSQDFGEIAPKHQKVPFLTRSRGYSNHDSSQNQILTPRKTTETKNSEYADTKRKKFKKPTEKKHMVTFDQTHFRKEKQNYPEFVSNSDKQFDVAYLEQQLILFDKKKNLHKNLNEGKKTETNSFSSTSPETLNQNQLKNQDKGLPMYLKHERYFGNTENQDQESFDDFDKLSSDKSFAEKSFPKSNFVQ